MKEQEKMKKMKISKDRHSVSLFSFSNTTYSPYCSTDMLHKSSLSFDFLSLAIEGYIIIVTGIDEEATEEEVIEKFADFGKVQNCHLNLDRRTGYVKGYALLEFSSLSEANQAIDACKDGLTLMDKELKAGFAFVQPPEHLSTKTQMGIRGSASRGKANRDRSRSPDRR